MEFEDIYKNSKIIFKGGIFYIKRFLIITGSFIFLLSTILINPIKIQANELDDCLISEPADIIENYTEKLAELNANPSTPVTKTVNTTVSDTMSQGGCWASVTFKISGTYTYAYISGTYKLLSHNLSVTIFSAPSDWTVAIDNIEYEMSDVQTCIIKIRYHYKASYFDCAFTGGYQYTMKTVGV